MKQSKRNRKRNLIASIVTGLVAAMCIVVMGALLIGILQHKELLPPTSSNILTFAIQALAILLGSFVAGKREGGKYAICCGSTGLVACVLMLLTTVMFFRCEFDRAGWGILACLAGGSFGCMLSMLSGKKQKRKRKNW